MEILYAQVSLADPLAKPLIDIDSRFGVLTILNISGYDLFVPYGNHQDEVYSDPFWAGVQIVNIPAAALVVDISPSARHEFEVLGYPALLRRCSLPFGCNTRLMLRYELI